MSTIPNEMLTDHEYDGIREYDNPTPGWWTAIFVVTIIFSIVYWLYFDFCKNEGTMYDAHRVAVAADLRAQFAEIGELQPDEATLLKYLHDPKWSLVGQMVFKARCVSCHGANAEGIIGPNLTDDSYKNVKQIADIAKVVADGAANGAMPPWKNQLHPNEVVLVSAYVASLRGQNIPSTRAAEGVRIPPWPAGAGVANEKK